MFYLCAYERMSEREYLAALYGFTAFGPARTKLLLDYFGSAKKVWGLKDNALLEINLSKNLVDKFVEYREAFDPKDYFRKLKSLGINFLTKEDTAYPANLKDIDDAPVVLYVKGKLEKSDVNSVAIIGTRKMTSYGKEIADRFAAELAGVGVTVVSGLALGIDAVAHKSALDIGGRTIAVLASGLDIVTPASNRNLANEIVKREGALVSEYPLGQPPLRGNFPSRNRIISGLSKAVVVVEGAKKSGTLLTASAAAEQGRTVFAVPGQISSPMSEAPHFLIKNGAKTVTSVKDILEELDMQLKVDRKEIEKVMPSGKEEELLLKIVEKEPLHLDEIARISTLKVADVSAILTVMEMRGLIKNVGGGVYKRV